MTASEINDTIKDAVRDAFENEKRRGTFVKSKSYDWLLTTLKWVLALIGLDWVFVSDIFEEVIIYFKKLFGI
jgi:phosphoserine phosphatase